jgi:NAD(P)-dependent dehydrogenase (short-subunit alcohol dehydrogenase family)
MTTLPQTILITGASSGIGKALAASYAQEGKTLILIGRDARRLEDAAAECRSFGAFVEIGAIDVRDSEKMREFILKMDERHRIDLLIANAGVSAIVSKGGNNRVRRNCDVGFRNQCSWRHQCRAGDRATNVRQRERTDRADGVHGGASWPASCSCLLRDKICGSPLCRISAGLAQQAWRVDDFDHTWLCRNAFQCRSVLSNANGLERRARRCNHSARTSKGSTQDCFSSSAVFHDPCRIAAPNPAC